MKILISPGYGSGLDDFGFELRTDLHLIKLVEDGKWEEAETYIESKSENEWDIYTGGLRDAIVVEIESGKRFRITEYDGAESLEYDDDGYWWVAE